MNEKYKKIKSQNVKKKKDIFLKTFLFLRKHNHFIFNRFPFSLQKIEHLYFSFGHFKITFTIFFSSEINQKIANDFTLLSDRLDQESLSQAIKSSIECCRGSISDKREYDDFLNELNCVYLRSQTFPVYYYSEMIREFDAVFSTDSKFKTRGGAFKDDSRKLTTVKNLNHLVTKQLPFGKFGFLFDQSANRFVNFLRSYQSILKIGLEMDKVANEQASFAIGKYTWQLLSSGVLIHYKPGRDY